VKKMLLPIMSIVLIVGQAFSQDQGPVRFSLDVQPSSIEKGQKGEAILVCEIAPEHHISAAESGLFQVTPRPLTGIQFDQPEYPEGEEEEYVGTVYRGRVEIPVPFVVGEDAAEGQQSLVLEVTIQACDENTGVCFAPETRNVEAVMAVLSGQGRVSAADSPTEGIAGRLDRSLERGSWIAFFIVFLGGLITSFTPCVYPMIPITLAVIGAQATGGKLRGFVLSLFYVLGIAVTFSILGVIAAKTGGLFGSYAQHPVAVVLIAAIFLLMGLSMLGVFVLQMPSALASKLQGKRRSGFIGAWLTGLVAGLIVSPCISPLLVVILTFVARTGSIVMGVGLLFTFALGLGVLFIVIGTFSGVLKNLPRSGGWMELIERGFGTLLVILAVVFLRPILPAFIYYGIWAVFLVLLGTFMGAFTPLDRESDRKRKIGKAVGVLAVVAGSFLLLVSMARMLNVQVATSMQVERVSEAEDMWLPSDEEGFQQARLTGRPVLMDFFAEWCSGCHELDEKTWPDGNVVKELDRYVRVKLDLTMIDERTQAIQQKYQIIGMPTVIIFDPAGTELGRFVGYKPPEEVVDILKQYK